MVCIYLRMWKARGLPFMKPCSRHCQVGLELVRGASTWDSISNRESSHISDNKLDLHQRTVPVFPSLHEAATLKYSADICHVTCQEPNALSTFLFPAPSGPPGSTRTHMPFLFYISLWLMVLPFPHHST